MVFKLYNLFDHLSIINLLVLVVENGDIRKKAGIGMCFFVNNLLKNMSIFC